MPCVFIPYYTENILDLYKNEKTLTDALLTKFMANGRAWQNNYALNNLMKTDNLLMPCSIRDHYVNFRQHITKM